MRWLWLFCVAEVIGFVVQREEDVGGMENVGLEMGA